MNPIQSLIFANLGIAVWFVGWSIFNLAGFGKPMPSWYRGRNGSRIVFGGAGVIWLCIFTLGFIA
jgi:hypothetical protein